MKNLITLMLLIAVTTFASAQTKILHDFTVKDINGNTCDLSTLKGKKVLVVNVASKCGLTPQYAQLQELYDKYQNRDFIIIGFPCNNFREQEPGTNKEIQEFCQMNYGVKFPIMDKVQAVGDYKSPIYKWLTEKSENGKIDADIRWNFQKFMIDENGLIVDCILPQAPFYEKVADWIEDK
ncbi:MAG: glutathione peroxidase [Tannerella sp.]|jgi:glutathione peroxidase|nr:glutathione peroxidase [Tannerella sp.]